MARFREILSNRNFFLLWLGQIVSQFGDRLTQMALIGLVYQRAAGSTLQLAKTFSFTILPVFVIGPVAGVYVDRWNRRYTLIVCDLLRAIIIASIPLVFLDWNNLVPVYILIFLSFCVSRFYVPAKLSIIPDLVVEKDLLIANSLANITGMIAAGLGFLLGGLLVEVLGADGAFYVDSLTFFISCLFVLSISQIIGSFKPVKVVKVSKEVFEVIRKSVFVEIKEGIIYLIRHQEIRLIATMLFILGAASGAVYITVIVFIQDVLNTITLGIGALLTCSSAGLLLGTLLHGRFGHKFSLIRTIFVCFASSGVVLILFTILINMFPMFIVAAGLAFVFGLVIAPVITASFTLVHRVADEKMRGKIFSSFEIVMYFAFLISMLGSSGLAEVIGRFHFLIYIGIIFVLVGSLGAAINTTEPQRLDDKIKRA